MSDEEALKKTEVQDNLEEALDKYLLKRLKKADASPQFFEIARRRLKDLRKSEEAGEDNSAARRLAAELEKDPSKMEATGVPPFIPEVCEEADAAVG